MSDIENSSDSNAIESQPEGYLTEEVIVQHLKFCQSTVMDHARSRFGVVLKQLEEHILDRLDAIKTNREQVDVQEQLRLYRQNTEKLQRYFLGYLGEGFVKFKRGELETRTGEERYQGDMLALVENEDLEETIAISTVTHRAEARFIEALWYLNQRLSVLNGGKKVDDRSNPSGPVQYCESLRKALLQAPLDMATKIAAYKVLDQELISQLAEPLQELGDYLKSSNILPNLRYRADTSSGSGDPSVDADRAAAASLGRAESPTGEPVDEGLLHSPDPTLPSGEYQSRLMGAIRTLQNHINAVAPVAEADDAPSASPLAELGAGPATAGGAAGPAGQPMMMFSGEQMIGAVQNLQMQAKAVTAQQFQDAAPGTLQPFAIAAMGGQLADQLKQQGSGDEQVDPVDMHTIDLVGMLFEYMLSDDNLPDSVKALLSYLHTPFLKVAFIDKDFFEETEHPARLLLNNMAESGVKWVGNDGSTQFGIYDKIKDIVSRVLEEFDSDVRLFAELLLDFSAFTKSITRRQEMVEKRAMEKVQGEEKLREVKLRVNQEVRSRTDGKELPSAVLLMLLQPWSDYLAFVLLRFGGDSEMWARSVKAIDDILWSIEPKETNAEKTRQLEMTDSLIDLLETGFETIGYESGKGKKLLEALFSLQKMALQSRQIVPAPEPVRSKLEAMADANAGKVEEVDVLTAEEKRVVEHLKMIEFGTWFEFEGGRRLKVAWFNSRTMHYMLVDQMGKKVAMKTGLELARDMLSHRARVIAGSSKPFFERALENIFNTLNSRAAQENTPLKETDDE